ncbi:MAG TPA: hypothetical protein VNF28_02015 [Candidatus Binataceae bacterium]|nr:hypothetical protein [Candidatus Binataceae bacterium]
MAITEKTRQADEKLREQLRNADIGKLKKLMAPLIEKTNMPSSAKGPRKRAKIGKSR